MRLGQWLESIRQDARYAVRAMKRSPASTAVAIATLAIGIGINATVFTVTNAVLFKGFAGAVRNDRLVYISDGGCCVAYPDFEDYRDQSRSFQSMAIVHGVSFVYSDPGRFVEHVESNENSAEVFRVVGQRPLLGRDFTAADEADGAPLVGILNYQFWERRYQRDPDVIGRVVKKNGLPMTIVGVMPDGFSFPQRVDVWVPLMKTAPVLNRGNRNTWCVVARLADGATIEQGRAEILAIAGRLASQYPDTNRDFRPVVGRFDEFFIGSNATLIYGSMWGAVGFVLLIACANLANLLLARALQRSRELSISVALGARQWRIIQQLLVESVMLSAVGGFFGWWIARWGVRAYELAMTDKSAWLIIDYTMDERVLGYLIAVSVVTGVLFGLVPALRLSRLDINVALKDGGRGATIGGQARQLSALLVVAETALAVVLLAGAGVMIRSYLKIHGADMGVDLARVIGGSIDLPASRYPDPENRTAFYTRLATRLQALPGVESVATTDTLPSWGSAKVSYEVAGTSLTEAAAAPKLSTLKISPSYFRTVGASIVSGRAFTDADDESARPVAIVNQLFARQFWPQVEPAGQRFRVIDGSTPGPWITVVGVASNIVQNDLNRQRVDPVIYRPYRQQPGGGAWVMVRTSDASAGLINAFRREVQVLDPELPLYGPMLVTNRLERFWDSRFYGSLFLIFAGIALLLASIGLYTVVAHSVRQRTQEIGVRITLGASSRDILTLVCRQGLLPSALGLCIGLVASLGINRLLASQLVQVSPWDPAALAVAAFTMTVAASFGCLIPALRAMRVDPIVALRHD
jgi:putative ABC transport system permease protein